MVAAARLLCCLRRLSLISALSPGLAFEGLSSLLVPKVPLQLFQPLGSLRGICFPPEKASHSLVPVWRVLTHIVSCEQLSPVLPPGTSSAARQPTMLNFGASLQQAAVSHLGVPCPGSPARHVRAAGGREPEPLTAAPEHPGCSAGVGEPGVSCLQARLRRGRARRQGGQERRPGGERRGRERQVCSRCNAGKGQLRGEAGGK